MYSMCTCYHQSLYIFRRLCLLLYVAHTQHKPRYRDTHTHTGDSRAYIHYGQVFSFFCMKMWALLALGAHCCWCKMNLMDGFAIYHIHITYKCMHGICTTTGYRTNCTATGTHTHPHTYTHTDRRTVYAMRVRRVKFAIAIQHEETYFQRDAKWSQRRCQPEK